MQLGAWVSVLVLMGTSEALVTSALRTRRMPHVSKLKPWLAVHAAPHEVPAPRRALGPMLGPTLGPTLDPTLDPTLPRTIGRQLRLFNTLTRAKDPFEPAAPPRVTFYSCGPTVYDHAHIGNFRAFLSYDVLKVRLRHCTQIRPV